MSTVAVISSQIKEYVSDARVQQWLLAAGMFVFLAAVGELVLDSPRYFIATLFVIAAGVLLTTNLRLALFLFIIFLGAYEEFVISSRDAFFSQGIQGSIIAVRIFGIGLLDFCTIIFAVPALILAWYKNRTEGIPFIRRHDILVLPLVGIWVYGMLMGAFHMHTVSTYAADIRVLGYLLVFYFIVSRVLDKPEDYYIAVWLFAGTIFFKTFFFIGRQLMGLGFESGYGYYRLFLGSDPALVGFLLVLSVSMVFLFRDIKRPLRILLYCLVAYATVFLIAGLGRNTYLFSAVSLGVIFFLFREQMTLRTLLLAVLLAVGAVLFFYYVLLTEENQEMISYVLSTAFNWVEAVKLYSDMSIGQRVLEAINIWATLDQQGMQLLGLGWGAAWREVAIHHPMDIGAFSLVEQMKGVHTSAHLDPIHYLLKIGVLGVIVIYAAMFNIWRKAVVLFRSSTDEKLRFALLGCIFMGTMFLLNNVYFSRLQFLLGLAFAGIAVIYQHATTQASHTGIAHSDDAQ